ncbi:GUN4 domain-containing protein [[Limnothrix rosea] IAM M-220]|uniref:GUN4 domain-containing protein n=1 Tax=[Limnothrix rosea] IAM M-220 TaxID=454133 RepID=UPI00095A813D|nr:GUN4 domain-containing protein [[Limnothrix rosea] IAM M-220]OKH17749.1 hypothetical protein NIES208_07960 [[Limnothrix rosea] IAM M-220]
MKLLPPRSLAIATVSLITTFGINEPWAAEPSVSDRPAALLQPDDFYRHLETALLNQEWQTANDLTRTLLLNSIFPKNYAPIQPEQLACETLQIADGMWRQYSGGQFGFSVQGNLATPLTQATTHRDWVNQWGDRLGWYQPTPPTERSTQWQTRDSFPWQLSDEINYSTTAPQGHLPWIGEDANKIISLSEADKATCGSCAYDAFYMQSERY